MRNNIRAGFQYFCRICPDLFCKALRHQKSTPSRDVFDAIGHVFSNNDQSPSSGNGFPTSVVASTGDYYVTRPEHLMQIMGSDYSEWREAFLRAIEQWAGSKDRLNAEVFRERSSGGPKFVDERA
jgi:hypothetical protein